ncbi:MAG: diiron oxygenase [Verrucomicrobia bacterium]|nr:diiron oxygenase [Verrucomicrobiota bacterium]
MNPTTLDPARFRLGVVDKSRRFLPESLTPLAHTSVYAVLSPAVRLRYNQLFASAYHEQFIYLESMLAGPILPALMRHYAGDPLAERLRIFQAEERIHSHWFHLLHRASEPALYADNRHVFVSSPRLAQRIFDGCARRPAAFPFVLWLAMIIEERTLPASREIIREADSLEPHYVALHRLHAADEAGHVSCDAELIRRLWPALSPAGRLLNRWLFVTLLREFFQAPKRAGWAVVLQLAREHPEITPLLPRLRREINALGSRADYLGTLYSRAREPRTFALADRFRELRRLEQDLLPAPAGHTL